MIRLHALLRHCARPAWPAADFDLFELDWLRRINAGIRCRLGAAGVVARPSVLSPLDLKK